MADVDIFIAYYLGIFVGVAFLLWVYKFTDKRGADIVYGKVVDIMPGYRSVKYICHIDMDGYKEQKSFYAKNVFQRYRMGSSVRFYAIETKYGVKFKIVDGYYTFVYLLLVIPFITMIGIGLNT